MVVKIAFLHRLLTDEVRTQKPESGRKYTDRRASKVSKKLLSSRAFKGWVFNIAIEKVYFSMKFETILYLFCVCRNFVRIQGGDLCYPVGELSQLTASLFRLIRDLRDSSFFPSLSLTTFPSPNLLSKLAGDFFRLGHYFS